MQNGKQPVNIEGQSAAEDCIGDELLLRYFEGTLPEKETKTVQRHLNSCPICFQVMAALAKNAITPFSETEKQEVEKLITLTPEEQVAKIIAYAGESRPALDPSLDVKRASDTVPAAASRASTDIWRRLREAIASLQPPPRYALAVSIIVALLFVSVQIYQVVIKKDRYREYVYDDKVPYEYDTSGLRGAPAELETDILFRSFVSQFKLGMSNYMIRDYQNAIASFEILQPNAIKLQARVPDKNLAPWIRDFYFYNGVSHLALLRSKRIEHDQAARLRHAEEAIQSLMKADSLVRSNDLERSDRETYFLGLAYGFGGNQDSAIARLHQIQPRSRFYEDSDKLTHEWSNK